MPQQSGLSRTVQHPTFEQVHSPKGNCKQADRQRSHCLSRELCPGQLQTRLRKNEDVSLGTTNKRMSKHAQECKPNRTSWNTDMLRHGTRHRHRDTRSMYTCILQGKQYKRVRNSASSGRANRAVPSRMASRVAYQSDVPSRTM
jgi:hypothetical protein